MKTPLILLAVLAIVFMGCETPPPPPPPPPAKATLLDLVENQNIDKIRQMFGLDEDVNSVNAQGQSALHIAAIKDLSDIAAVLLARGATVDLQDADGNTPLHLAVKNGSTKILPVLAQYGASLFSVDKTGKSVLQTALQQNPNLIPLLVTKKTIGNQDSQGNTVLHVAASQGLESLVGILIQLGASEQTRNSAGLTPLDVALQFPQSLPHAGIAWKMIQDGAPQPLDKQVRYFWMAGHAHNPNLAFDMGQTPLDFAASRGHLGLLKVLVQQGANIHAIDQPGNTPLHHAVAAGDVDAATYLLDQGADINARDFNNNSTLHLGLTSPHPLEMTNFLLGRGAKPEIKNNFGNTALHLAVSLGLPPELAKALAAKGADVNSRNKRGDSPLLTAVQQANQPMITTLLALGANPFAGNNADLSPLTESIRLGLPNLSWLITAANKSQADDNGNTPLHIAVAMGKYPEAVKYLLSIGSNPNERNKQGQSPLHLAVTKADLLSAQSLFGAGGDLFLIDNAGRSPLSLIFHGDPTFADAFFTGDVLEARDSARNTPLFLAIQDANATMVNLLIQKGANVNAQNLSGQTPLHVAVATGSLAMVKLLLAAKADVNALDGQGNAPLHGLVVTFSQAIGETLLNAGADSSLRNKDGRTLLHDAVSHGIPDLVTWLLAQHANPNVPDNHGRTPLFDASAAASPAMVSLLLASGANANLRDDTGSTVLHAAAGAANADVIRLLMNAGADLFAENAVGLTPVAIALRGTPDNWKIVFNPTNVNLQNNRGQSVLHLAVLAHSSPAAIQFLLGLGAHIQLRDKDGKTALDEAIATGQTSLVDVLDPHSGVKVEKAPVAPNGAKKT